jgi:murein L,D-transpeptidase YcbB/YkuD
MRSRGHVIRLVLIVTIAATTCARLRVDAPESREATQIRMHLESDRPDYVRHDKEGNRLWSEMRELYRERAYAPLWLDGHRPTDRVQALIDAVNGAIADGLDPSIYALDEIIRGHEEARKGFLRARGFDREEAGPIDVRLTYTYLQFASDLADGISDLATADSSWKIRRPRFDASAHLAAAIEHGDIKESLESLKPTTPEYVAMRRLLAEYRGRAAAGGSTITNADQSRIQQIELNLERWRWAPRARGERHIVVNIPAYRLDVWNGRTIDLTMRVVVGKKDTPTPIFGGDMTYIVFSPYWNVPPGIANDETLPSVMRDPDFLARTNMEVLDASGKVVDPESIDLDRAEAYRFRQRPGAHNSLGLVKFMFPNEHNVYLHDTPADSLFARRTRSFSHGCVRLEQPQALAEYVLSDQPEWTPDKIVDAMHAGEERAVRLKRPIPVYLGYWTVDISRDGAVTFAPDVYGLDARQARTLSTRVEQMRSAARPPRSSIDQECGGRPRTAISRAAAASASGRQGFSSTRSHPTFRACSS